jgi:CHAD domain-containing protein
MARAELRDARAVVRAERPPLRDRVHDVRTSIKKVRALTRLVRPAVGRPARRENRRLRKIARAVSGVRDAEVLLTTFDNLAAELGASRSASLRQARGRLAARLRESARPFRGDDRAYRRLASRLRTARRKVKRWTVPAPDGWRAVIPGFVDGYRQARRAMNAAARSGAGEDFHAWRRAAKAHRHHVFALEAICPRRLKPRLEDLDRLGDLLGDEHDLDVLEQTIRGEWTCFPDERDCDRVLRLLDRRRRGLRREARAIGARLFAERPSDFGRRARADFRAFRHA